MESIFPGSDCLLKESDSDPHTLKGKSDVDGAPEELLSDWKNYLVCIQCLQIITTPANRISIDGAHMHTFANPHGIVFEIGCFGAASGCSTTGPATDDFTWFKGYQWKIAVCRRCLNHLGWRFVSSASLFYGIITDRLMEQKIDNYSR